LHHGRQPQKALVYPMIGVGSELPTPIIGHTRA
jgi:hypothetical protein